MTSKTTLGIWTKNCELKSKVKEKDDALKINTEFEKIAQIDEIEEENYYEGIKNAKKNSKL